MQHSGKKGTIYHYFLYCLWSTKTVQPELVALCCKTVECPNRLATSRWQNKDELSNGQTVFGLAMIEESCH